jgi:pimeloyl-ACP methyl ester carboxylesterase
MELPAGLGVFPDGQAKDRYFVAYETAMAAGPEPVETCDVETRFGMTRVYRFGPEDGSPIVLVPAFWATAAMWAPNVGALAAHHPVYCLDVLGQPGASVQTMPLRTPQDCAAWLDDVLTARDLRGVHLVGWSYGGWLAFNQALHAPERLATITLIEPANVFAPPSAKFKLTVVTLLPISPRKLTRRAMAWAFGNPAVGDPMHPIVDLIVAGAHDFRALGTSPAPQYPNDSVLASVHTPTLVLLGGRSVYHDAVAAATRARRFLSEGEVELWPTASHAVAAERPDEVHDRILSFVQNVGEL